MPATLVVSGGGATLTLENILVGDVRLLGGQSNMQHPILRSEDGDLEIASAHHPWSRILTVPAQEPSEPLHVSTSRPEPSPDSGTGFRWEKNARMIENLD